MRRVEAKGREANRRNTRRFFARIAEKSKQGEKWKKILAIHRLL
jgi:hypothetical protein